MTNDNKLLKTKTVDLLLDINVQMNRARQLLGPDAPEEAVKADAERRVARARALRKQLEKPLGTADRPFPMTGAQRIASEDADLAYVNSAIASSERPLLVYSDRSLNEVTAIAMCDMPVPSMLYLFQEGLERRRPESTNRQQFMIGDPGHGKSFLGALQSRLRDRGPAEVFDCGGRNMNDLLFEMVLDFGKADALPDAIDKRIRSGELKDMSYGQIALLNSLETAPENLKEEELAEWMEKTTIVTYDDTGRPVIDWKKLSTGSAEKINRAYEILTKVSSIEGLDKAGGNALGMNSQYGALIRAFIEGREIVLDEYNKSRDGTDNMLQTVWQFINGEIDYCRVENPLKNKDASAGPSYFEFKREDVGIGFFVTLTGNKQQDGTTTRALNKSVYSRLSPETLPDPSKADWQHRICQMLTGVPLSTIYNMAPAKFDENTDAFANWLLWVRREKAKLDGMPVPSYQEDLLRNWPDVLSATESLAELFVSWERATNANKLIENSMGDLIEEVDQEYSDKEGMDFRKIKQIFERALAIRPQMQKADAAIDFDLRPWTAAPKRNEPQEESLSLHLGTRLVEVIEDMIFRKTEGVGKHKLYEVMKKAMEKSCLRDIFLQEAQRSQKKSVESAFNISPYNTRDPGKQAMLAQKVVCDYLRRIDPNIDTASDDDIITVKKLRDAIQQVAALEENAGNDFFVINSNVETLVAGKAFAKAALADDYVAESRGETLDVRASDLVGHDDFMTSLAVPVVGTRNLNAIWEQNLSLDPSIGQDETTPDGVVSVDEKLNIAQNKSSSGIAATSVLLGSADGKGGVLVHVIRNEAQNKTLIVGDALPSQLRAAFNEAGIYHVDRHAEDAENRIEQALSEVMRGANAATRENVKGALAYRLRVSDDFIEASRPATVSPDDDFYFVEAQDRYINQAPLARLMVDDNIKINARKCIVKAA